MQQAALVLVDLDPGGEQVGVVAAAGRADDPRVVPGREDDRRVDAAVGGRAQRVLHRLVGHVVGRGDDQLAAGRVHQRLEHLGHGRVAHRRPGADHLRGEPRPASAGSGCAAESSRSSSTYVIQSLGEQVLVLPGDRPFEAHHGVDPGGVLRLDQELRIGAVLAAAIGDAVVDDDDLAMVAQVDAAARTAAAADCRSAGPRPRARRPRAWPANAPSGSSCASRGRRPWPGRSRRARPRASAPRRPCSRCCPAARCRTADGHDPSRRRCRPPWRRSWRWSRASARAELPPIGSNPLIEWPS